MIIDKKTPILNSSCSKALGALIEEDERDQPKSSKDGDQDNGIQPVLGSRNGVHLKQICKGTNVCRYRVLGGELDDHRQVKGVLGGA